MSYIDLTCRESFSLMNGVKCAAYMDDKLHIGCNIKTYLFFDFPPTAFFSCLKEARLILFKIPANVSENPLYQQCNDYIIYPLLDFFSIYSNCYMPPKTDEILCLPYKDQAYMSYTEIDMTAIAQAWIKGKIENKGLLLTGSSNSRHLVYASDQYRVAGMRPMLRFTYKGISRPLSVAPCTVEVNE